MSFNVLLDGLPIQYEGHRINTDFRIGVQMSQAVEDPELNQTEKIAICVDLLFGGEDSGPLPDPKTAAAGVQWFLTGWVTDRPGKEKTTTPIMDFDVDQWRIYAAFRSQYHIDLNTADLHFWVFMALLSTLNECAYTRVLDIRTRKPHKKASAEEKKMLAELKKRFALETKESAEERAERERIAREFLAGVTIHKGEQPQWLNSTEVSE